MAKVFSVFVQNLSEYNNGKIVGDWIDLPQRKEIIDKFLKERVKIENNNQEYEIADIDDSEWYLLSRDSNPGYLGFGEDADRMANLASVFPVLFFLVAALVCLTTMTRMIDEQRTQIGSLKALGYTTWAI